MPFRPIPDSKLPNLKIQNHLEMHRPVTANQALRQSEKARFFSLLQIHKIDAVMIEDGSFEKIKFSQGLVIFGDDLDFHRTGLGQLVLKFQYEKSGALAFFELLLFCFPGGFGKLTCFAC